MNKISAILRICLLLPLLALMLASDSIAQGFEPRIVFASNRDGDWDIYSMDANGDNLVQLTDHPASDEVPACSPDGRRIVFRSERDLTPDLYVMGSDGNNVIRLTQDNFREGRPSWSPDGTKMVFSSSCKINCDIFTMDADGNDRTRLAKEKMWDVWPSWSPDGSKIAFAGAPDGVAGATFNTFVMNADGTERRNLTGNTHLENNDSLSPAWSPDGHKIAFISYRHFVPGGSRNDIFVITADGKELEQLTDGPGSSTSPVYSPDGTKIAYVSGGRGNSNIHIMDAHGNNPVNLTRTPGGIENEAPSWPHGGLAVTRTGKLPISWGELKRVRNP